MRIKRIFLFPFYFLIELYVYYKIFEYIYKSMPMGDPVDDYELPKIVERYLTRR